MRKRPAARLAILLLALTATAVTGGERITPTDALPLLQSTFQFMVTADEEHVDAHFVVERVAAGVGNQTMLPPMIGRCSLMRGRNLVVVTLLPEKDGTLFQLAVNGNGCGHRLIDRHPDDAAARADAAAKYAFLPKAEWAKERRGLILSEGPDRAPGRIRCVLIFFRPDPANDERPGQVFGQIDGVDGF